MNLPQGLFAAAAIFAGAIAIAGTANSSARDERYLMAEQGDGAWRGLVRGLHMLDAHPRVSVIVLTRGGGSLEDLWNFNREELVRAIHELETPVISAIVAPISSPAGIGIETPARCPANGRDERWVLP